MHMHIGGKENENIFFILKIIDVGAQNSKKLFKNFWLHSNKDH
jgi:hypothetical protein